MKEYVVRFTWDDEAYVWLASSEDVPGLALEAGSLDALMERTRYAIPDLLDLKDTNFRINFKAERITEATPDGRVRKEGSGNIKTTWLEIPPSW